jgi:hypothetical protein
MTATKHTMSRDRIEKASRDMMALLEESGLSPVEGLTAVEALYSLLLLRGMDAAGAGTPLANTAKELALRSLDRMSSRVLAWPARVEDRS